jgi:predicted RNA-binding protein
MTLKNELVCVGSTLMTSRDMIDKKTGIAVKSNQVFMQPGTYPKIERV